MAQIPLGNFGQITAAPVRSQRVSTQVEDNTSQILQQAVGRIGGAVTAAFEYDKEIKEMDAATEAIRYGSQLKELRSNLQQQYDEGLITYDQLDNAYSQGKQKLQRPSFEGHDPIFIKRMENALYADDVQSDDAWREVSTRAKKSALQVSTLAGFDEVMKQNIDNPQFITSWVDSPDMERKGRIAFGEEWALKKTALKEQAWQANYIERANRAGEDVGQLQALAADLDSDAAKSQLDPMRRMQMKEQLLGKIERQREIAENRAIRAAEKQERLAERALNMYVSNIHDAAVMPEEDRMAIYETVKGTSLEPQFNAIVQQEKAVQSVLNAPLAVQEQWLAENRERMEKEGSTPEQRKLLDAVDSSIKKTREIKEKDPLQYIEKTTQEAAAPFDPTAPETWGETFTQRDAQVYAANKQLTARGEPVKRQYLRADELEAEVDTLRQLPADQQAERLGSYATAFAGNGEGYNVLMRQFSDKSPSYALAGKWVQGGRKRDAVDLLKGDKALTDKTVSIPSDNKIDLHLQDYQSAFRGNSRAWDNARQAVKAIYAANVEASGKAGDVVDKEAMKDAVGRVIGQVGKIGNSAILIPHGVEKQKHLDAVMRGFKSATSRIGEIDADDVQFIPVEGGRYQIYDGREPKYSMDGKPIYVMPEYD